MATASGAPVGVVHGRLISAMAPGRVAEVSTTLQQLLDRHIEAGTIPGAVALVDDGQVEVVAAGTASVGGVPMPEDAIMRIQSMTKVITAAAALRLVEAGRLDFDDPLVDWLPELADRRVLRTPAAELDDTVPARRPITLRHLLTNTSGYGMMLQPSPLQRAMAGNGTEAGPEPPALSAADWLGGLADLPLAFHPGEGWRYHHSFGVLGILISRVTGRGLGEYLADDIFDPLGMTDTEFWVPKDKCDRLPAAYRHGADGLVETEPAGAGWYAGVPPYDVSHSELVSTVRDFHRFARALVGADPAGPRPLISAEHREQLATDQVPPAAKTPDSFFPGFWNGMGWGFGVGVQTQGPRRGRIGWAGGQGTDFFIDPDGAIGILLTQVEMGSRMSPLITEFQTLRSPSAA
jgi:CubicO group peptidase (beta-lactamase class C family)